jgi:hypothetical protein
LPRCRLAKGRFLAKLRNARAGALELLTLGRGAPGRHLGSARCAGRFRRLFSGGCGARVRPSRFFIVAPRIFSLFPVLREARPVARAGIGTSARADARPPLHGAALLVPSELGSLGRHALVLRRACAGEELLARGLEDLALFEDLAAEDEATLRGYLGSSLELNTVREDDAHALSACPSRAARAMRVHNLSVLGEVETDHMTDARYVEASGP